MYLVWQLPTQPTPASLASLLLRFSVSLFWRKPQERDRVRGGERGNGREAARVARASLAPNEWGMNETKMNK